MPIHLTKPDAGHLAQLLAIVEGIRVDYPELFSREDLTTLLIAGQLIRSINK